MKLEEIINFSTLVNSTKDFMKRYKQLRLLDILVHARHQRFHGEPTIHSFWLIDGKLMKIKVTQKMMKLISHSMVILEEVVTE